MEIRAPTSWLAALIALTFALGGVEALSASFLRSYYFFGIVIGFVLHELAHAEVARRYGLSASFVAYVPGLAITFASGLLPIKILAPGYVKISGYGSPAGIFYATVAGPLVNILVALFVLFLSIGLGNQSLAPIALVNAWMAFFNLLPIPPLDGSKILNYSFPAWAGLILISALLLYLWW